MILKKITGIILSQRPRGEFDRMIEVFSYEYGRMLVLAKGVRYIKSRRSFHLDLLNLVNMELEQNSGSNIGIKYLREISTIETFAELKLSYDSFSAACLISAFLTRHLPMETPQKTLFTLTKTTLEELNKCERTARAQSEANNPALPVVSRVSFINKAPQKILLTYFLKTLRLLGHLPNKLPQNKLRQIMWQTISDIDPQLTLNARRTLGTLSILNKTLSN